MPIDNDLDIKLVVTDGQGRTKTSYKTVLNMDAIEGGGHPLITVSPNPTTSNVVTIKTSVDFEEKFSLNIYDQMGVLVYSKKNVNIKKDNSLRVNPSKKIFGLYTLKLVSLTEDITYQIYFN